MNQPNKEPTLEDLEKNWQESMVASNKELVKTHASQEFSFSATERRQLVKIFTMETLAKQLIDDKLNNDTLIRVGIIPNNEIKILYDLQVGKFCVWTPRKKTSKADK